MPESVDTTAALDGEDAVEHDTTEAELVEDDLLVEDVSIDGMCGVY
jgi:mycofactocin precursor